MTVKALKKKNNMKRAPFQLRSGNSPMKNSKPNILNRFFGDLKSTIEKIVPSTQKVSEFGSKVLKDAGSAISQVTKPVQAEAANFKKNLENITSTDMPKKIVSDVKNVVTNLSKKNKELNEKSKKKNKNKKNRGNVFGK